MTFQYIRMREGCGVVYDDAGNVRQLTTCAVHLDEQHAADVYEYVKRFNLRTATIDWVLSLIFEMGLREMKAQTDLDRFLDEQDEQNMDKVRA